MHDKIEDCIWCNSKSTGISSEHRGDYLSNSTRSAKYYFVTCMSCGARGPISLGENDAIYKWNQGRHTVLRKNAESQVVSEQAKEINSLRGVLSIIYRIVEFRSDGLSCDIGQLIEKYVKEWKES